MNQWSGNQPDAADIWIKGTTQMMNEWVSKGWALYYVNFLFEPFRGPPTGIVPYMWKGVRKFYGQFCTEFMHDGRAKSEQKRLPKLWLFPDLPVFKYEKQSLRECEINGGLHFNGPMLIPPVSSFKECPIKHIGENRSKYARYGIERIHIVRGYDIPGLADYAAKNIKNRRTNEEDIMQLPRSVSELPVKKRPPFDPEARLLKDIQSRFNVCDEIARKMRDDVFNANQMGN
jgi:hypothetical protein